MTHTYKITGMTCGGCEANVKSSLLKMPHIIGVEVSREKQTATISMEKHVLLSSLQNAIEKKYTITAIDHNESAEQVKNWFETYKPLLIIFGYISIVAMIAATGQGNFNIMKAMNVFMAGFFLTFSFFKMLDLKAFAESYSQYDIVAKKLKLWGFIYPFVELGLGLAYAIGLHPLGTNFVTVIVMTISIIGVLLSVFNKQKIQCACLGTVFKLPMSTVTIVEDALMITMSAAMLFDMCL